MNHFNIVVANHHFLIREGLKSAILKMYPSVNIYTASQAVGIFNLINLFKIDLVFLDSRLSQLNGMEVISMLKREQKDIKVIGNSISDDLNEIMNLINAGIDGYLMNVTCQEEISYVIEKIMSGEKYFANSINFLVANNRSKKMNEFNAHMKNYNCKIILSDKEKRILILICMQHSNKEIAGILNICEKTVEMHRSNIIVKTNAKNIIGCVLHAVEAGIYKSSKPVL